MLILLVILTVERVLLGLFLTTEAEYVAATEAGKEMIWLHGFLDELGKKQEMGILHNDSQSANFLAKNSAFHSKSKHI